MHYSVLSITIARNNSQKLVDSARKLTNNAERLNSFAQSNPKKLVFACRLAPPSSCQRLKRNWLIIVENTAKFGRQKIFVLTTDSPSFEIFSLVCGVFIDCTRVK